MTLIEWMHSVNIDPDKALLVSAGTDGFSQTKSSLMSVSYKAIYGTTTLYIKGADAAKVADKTGVTPEHYNEHALGPARVYEILKPQFEWADFIVCYAEERFTKPWLMQFCGDLLHHLPWLDMVTYSKLMEKPESIPADIPDMRTLAKRLPPATCMVKGNSYSFDAICGRHLAAGTTKEGPYLENRVEYLWDLYQEMLIKRP